jgi:hypothetical protein
MSESQQAFEEFVNKLSPNIETCHIPISLEGPIDLRSLDVPDHRPTELSFVDGGITELNNIPTTVRILRIDQNALTHLPAELKNLNICVCNNNKITDFNPDHFPKLEELYIADNQLSGHLGNLPPNLTTLEIKNNYLVELDMQNSPNCTYISCRNNPGMERIMNVPASGVSDPAFVCDYNSWVTVSYMDEEQNSKTSKTPGEPSDAMVIENTLDYYYKLKSRYENQRKDDLYVIQQMPIDVRDKKKMARAIPKKCVNCKKKGGTHFWRQNGTLRAECGAPANEKCKLNISIPLGTVADVPYLLKLTKDDMDEKQENIMRLKMDTLFNYISETASAKRFKEELEMYQADEAMHNTYKEYEENVIKDPIREKLIKKKTSEIQHILKDVRKMIETYKESGDRTVLRDAVDKQIGELHVEIQALRHLKYPVMEMIHHKQGVVQLIQKSYNLDKMDYTLLEPDISKMIIRSDIEF